MGLFGKLFDKKECAICGGEIGLLGNRKLEDGNMCKNCAAKLSPWFSDRKSSTVAEIEEQLQYREENKEAVAQFHITRTLGKNMKVLLDEDNRCFMVTSAKNLAEANPDVIRFEDVTGCNFDIKESRYQIQEQNPQGSRPMSMAAPGPGSVHSNPNAGRPAGRPAPQPSRPTPQAPSRPTPQAPSRPNPQAARPAQPVRQPQAPVRQPQAPSRPTPQAPSRPVQQTPTRPVQSTPVRPAAPMPGMNPGRPAPGMFRPNFKRYNYSYDFNITIFVNNPYFNEITFRLNSSSVQVQNVSETPQGLVPDPRNSQQYLEYYEMGNEIKAVLTGVRESVREEAASATAPKQYVICPYCGATTSTETGCCEYCGGPLS